MAAGFLFGAIVAKLQIRQMLIPGGECLLVLNVPAEATLDSLHTSLCKTVCLRVVGGGTPVVNKLPYHASVKLTLKLSTPISKQFCARPIPGKHPMFIGVTGVFSFLGGQGL